MTDSICKMEYIVASDAAKEAVWLRKFITELGVAPEGKTTFFFYRIFQTRWKRYKICFIHWCALGSFV